MTTLAVIPARGGSKGIPRKNMRLMGGRPLIEYAIRNAVECELVNVVAVTSDSEEILAFASQFEGVICFDRSSDLARDAVTLDPVVYDATVRAEEQIGETFDAVVTLQPTSPLLRQETLRAALEEFAKGRCDSLISVVNSPHLSWRKDDKGRLIPEYEKRLNRQQLPPRYLETGAFFVSRREFVAPDSRLGNRMAVFEVPSEESTDIDTREDWAVCESVLSRKKIAFRVDGYRELGLGHVYRTLTIAYSLVEHDVVFLCDPSKREGVEKLGSCNMPVVEVRDEEELIAWLEENRPDVFVNDLLDTDAAYVQRIKPLVGRFVSFEDLGSGARLADSVVNAIYEGAPEHRNTFVGERYVCLRDEFLAARPAPFSEDVGNVLVTFGGTDPLDLSARMLGIARQINGAGVRFWFDIVLGSGYSGEVGEGDPEVGVSVRRDVSRMSDLMREADLAVCSQGRTTFELAAMGVPAIVLAQNEREQLHTFARMGNGFINLGLGSEVSDEDVAAAIVWLASAKSIRREMRRSMLENDLRSGIRRVKSILLGED